MVGLMKTIESRVSKCDINIGGTAVRRITGREHGRIRKRILLRDEYTCQKCGRVDPGPGLEVDHIVPLDFGGAESDANRQVLCESCHKAKTAAEAGRRHGGG